MIKPVNEVAVFSQTQSQRIYVGRLWRDDTQFHFEYAKEYQKNKKAIPLGPEFPMWKSQISSKEFFPSLQDRIPSRNNPAFKDYCAQWGIDESEQDEFILLTTIGRRGPSTFIFEPLPQDDYSGEHLKKFRQRLGLNQADFEALFGVSHSTLVRLENSKSDNPVYRRYFEVFDHVPQSLVWLIEQRGIHLHDAKRDAILAGVLAEKR